jgi:hypothetical protein
MSLREAARADARAAQRELDWALALGEERPTTMARELARLSRRHHEARMRLQAADRVTNPDRTTRR